MKKHRGVIASRLRLYKALGVSGLDSQVALAERMADLEGLDAAPKDLVSRVFRELPVDPRSIERVARALGVESFALYKRSDEPDAESEHATQPAPSANTTPTPLPATPDPAKSRLQPLIASAAVLVVAALSWFALRDTGGGGPGKTAAPDPRLLADTSLMLLSASDNDAVDGFMTAARSALAQRFRVPSPGGAMALATLDPAHALEALDLDYALRAEVERFGRRMAIRVTLFETSASREIWAESFPRPWGSGQHEAFAANLSAAVVYALAGGQTPRSFPPADAQREYLLGMELLDRSRDELTVKRALTRLQSSLRLSQDYTEARAGLCRGLYEQSRLAGEVRFLEEAEQECERALATDPESEEAQFSLAQIMRKSGRLEASKPAYHQVLARNPGHVDALIGLAEANLASYLASANTRDRDAALEFAAAATRLDRHYWKGPYTTGRIQFLFRDLDAAVVAYEQARAIDSNPYVLSNLGSVYFCQGNYAQAANHYLAVKDSAPGLYVGDAQLGVVYLYQRDYDKAVEHLGRAVETLAAGAEVEEHRLWSNYADALRHQGDVDAALGAYEKAAALAEREYSQTPDDPNLSGFLGDYYAEIAVLDAEQQSPRVREFAIENLTRAAAATELESVFRVAQGWARLGRTREGRAALSKLKGQCDGAWGSPDFVTLRDKPLLKIEPQP